jgi:predicted nucleic acid-binding protein
MAGHLLTNSFAKIAIREVGEMYLDSAIIIKLLIREPDSEFFSDALSGQVLDSSELCLTEVHSALLSKEASRGISKRERQEATRKFEELVEEELLRLLPLDWPVLERATGILHACQPRIRLRTLDAIHVATCDLNRCETLCATDQRMRGAATQLGIRLFPAESEEIKRD